MLKKVNAGDTVFWRMRYRSTPELWSYETVEARVLAASAGPHALVELTGVGYYPRHDYRRPLHLMPLARLHASRAEAEAVHWHDAPEACPECGDPRPACTCFATVVNVR